MSFILRLGRETVEKIVMGSGYANIRQLYAFVAPAE